jgi:integrase
MAMAMARAWAVEHDAKIGAFKRLPQMERTLLVAAPTLPQVQDWKAALFEPKTVNLFEIGQKIRQQIAADVENAIAVADCSWDALYNEWKRISEAKKTRNHGTTIRLLKEFFPDADCRKITRADIGKFRDHLHKQGASWGTINQRLNHIKAMYAAVSKDPSSVFDGIDNPAARVVPVGKAPKQANGRDKAFTAAEVRLILDTASRLKFGDTTGANGLKRHAEVMWLLRLLAFTGARPNEIAQITADDVYAKDGIKLIHIRANHPEKSVKTGDREVPQHPDVLGFYDYARTFAPDAFVFGAFPHNKDGGRALWVIRIFGKFLKQCGIEGKTLYGLRHRFIDSTRESGMDGDLRRRLVGHSARDIHEKAYGGNLLKLLATEIAKTKPAG